MKAMKRMMLILCSVAFIIIAGLGCGVEWYWMAGGNYPDYTKDGVWGYNRVYDWEQSSGSTLQEGVGISFNVENGVEFIHAGWMEGEDTGGDILFFVEASIGEAMWTHTYWEAEELEDVYYLIAEYPDEGDWTVWINGDQVEFIDTMPYYDGYVNVGSLSINAANDPFGRYWGLEYFVRGQGFTDWDDIDPYADDPYHYWAIAPDYFYVYD